MKVCNNSKINFQAGLTKQFSSEIRHCDVQKISNEFANYNIPVDFKQNKVIAWCSLQSLKIIQKFEKGLPKGIFAENFNKFDLNNTNGLLAFCNAVPSRLYKNSQNIIEENNIFINIDKNWDKIDEFSDEYFCEGMIPTNFFLNFFLHEFAHVMHIKNLINLHGGVKYVKILNSSANYFKLPQKSYQKALVIAEICKYAALNPFETVANDLSNRIIKNIDKNTLDVNTEFIEHSPYRKAKFIDFNKDKDALSRILHNFWNGKI